jgi:hypothetical protein
LGHRRSDADRSDHSAGTYELVGVGALTDTINYVATDEAGLTATSTRTVTVEAALSIIPTDAASTTSATSSAQ